jgi:hypothetical protein
MKVLCKKYTKFTPILLKVSGKRKVLTLKEFRKSKIVTEFRKTQQGEKTKKFPHFHKSFRFLEYGTRKLLQGCEMCKSFALRFVQIFKKFH